VTENYRVKENVPNLLEMWGLWKMTWHKHLCCHRVSYCVIFVWYCFFAL